MNVMDLKGQTFVEIIIIVALVIVVIAALVASGTFSLRLTSYNKLRNQAIKYVQEGIELARKERDDSWGTLVSMAQPSPRRWCVDKSRTWSQASSDCSINIDNIFSRSIQLSYDPLTQRVIVLVSVSWKEGSEMRTSKAETILTKWR